MSNWAPRVTLAAVRDTKWGRGAEYHVLGPLLFRKDVFVVKCKGLISNISILFRSIVSLQTT